MNWFILLFLLISIILFLVTKYYVEKIDDDEQNLKEEIENFEEEKNRTPTAQLKLNHTITLDYLDKINASKLVSLNSDYMQNMNQPNLSARNCKTRDELYEKYKTGFDDITPKEKERVDLFILNLLDKIKLNNTSYYNYVCKWLKEISIAKAQSWLESGMPHTLEKTIIMDAGWFLNPRDTTLLHELTHIHQRYDYFDFEDLYKELGYYNNTDYIKGLDSIYPLNRNNPDGLSTKWLWKMPQSSTSTQSTLQSTLYNTNTDYWWIGALFKNVNPTCLSEVELVALKLNQDNEGNFYYLKQPITLLSQLKSFTTFFGENPNNYHPNEITAKMAEFYLVDNLNTSHHFNTKNNTNNKNNKNNKTKENKLYSFTNYEGYKIYKKYSDAMMSKYY